MQGSKRSVENMESDGSGFDQLLKMSNARATDSALAEIATPMIYRDQLSAAF